MNPANELALFTDGTDKNTVNENLRDDFRRQRRNLILGSVTLVLFMAADIRVSELHLVVTASVESPQMILAALWLAWAYWFFRYIQHHNDLGDKGYTARWYERMRRCAIRKASKRAVREWKARDWNLGPNDFAPDIISTGRLFDLQGHWIVRFHYLDAVLVDDRTGKVEMQPGEPEWDQILLGKELIIEGLVSWLWVATLTRLFSEYVLPFIIGVAPIAWLIYERIPSR